jgi:CRP-like cAMP-binding protein
MPVDQPRFLNKKKQEASSSFMVTSKLDLSHTNHSCQQSFNREDLLPLKPGLLWEIESGFVRTLTWDEEGIIATLGVWGAGDIVGKSLSKIEYYQIECMTTVKVRSLSFQSDYLQNAMLSNIQQMEEILNIIHSKRVSLRLLKFLNWLARRFGRETDQGWLIELRLTQQAIAEIIGTTRVTVTRLLKDFEQEGRLMRLPQYRILLHDL